MTDAPERIIITVSGAAETVSWQGRKEFRGQFQEIFVRADLHAAEVARLTAERDEARDTAERTATLVVKWSDRARAAEAALAASEERVKKLTEALEWYAEKAEGCRKITREGDEARRSLDHDGGKRARAALQGEGK